MDFALSLITIGPTPSCLPQRFPSNLHLSLINKLFLARLQTCSRPIASLFSRRLQKRAEERALEWSVVDLVILLFSYYHYFVFCQVKFTFIVFNQRQGK